MKEDLFPNGILLVSIHGKLYGHVDDLEKIQSSSGDCNPRMKTHDSSVKTKSPFKGFNLNTVSYKCEGG